MLAGTHLYNMPHGRLRCDTEGKTHNNTYNCPLLVNVSSFQTVMKVHLQLIPWKKKKRSLLFSLGIFLITQYCMFSPITIICMVINLNDKVQLITGSSPFICQSVDNEHPFVSL